MKTNRSVLTRLPASLGSLGLGSTIGTAAGLGAYLLVPTVSDHLSVHAASGLGGALGGAGGAAAARVLSPILRKGSHYLLMLELDVQVRCGWLSPNRAAHFRMQLQKQYFGARSRALEPTCAILGASHVRTPVARGPSFGSTPSELASLLHANSARRRRHDR